MRSGSGRSLHREQSRWGVSRFGILDPWPCAPSAVALDPKGDFRSNGSRPNHGFRWFGMFERSPVVLVETFICRSRTSARGLEGARE
jgi:hypothetical protein